MTTPTENPHGTFPPASPSPVADYLQQPRPGLSPDRGYVVLTRGVIERLPIPTQQRLVAALAEVHNAMDPSWTPTYRITPSRWVRICEASPDELAEVGIMAELGVDGTMVHRNIHTGQTLDDDALTQCVLVRATDPLQPR